MARRIGGPVPPQSDFAAEGEQPSYAERHSVTLVFTVLTSQEIWIAYNVLVVFTKQNLGVSACPS